jgi:magnesium-transporting ATPase (P-type)
MSERYLGAERPTSPDVAKSGEIRGDPTETALAAFANELFCKSECNIRSRIESDRLTCPYMVIERFDPNETDPAIKMLGTVANNTWVHCVDDVRAGEEPVILLDLAYDE